MNEPEPVRVFAAASLIDAFTDLEAAFEAERPEYDVELNFAGSATLRAQILDGAPADVFASANEEIMDEVIDGLGGISEAAVVGPPEPFARNRLQIAVPVGNPAGLSGLSDFENDSLFLGLCAETVPCGSFAARTLLAAAVEPSVDTREADVRALLTKIAAGELDAGIVYATDVQASADVEGITIPADENETAVYPIAVLGQGDSIAGGQAFVAFTLGDEGRQLLAGRGFDSP